VHKLQQAFKTTKRVDVAEDGRLPVCCTLSGSFDSTEPSFGHTMHQRWDSDRSHKISIAAPLHMRLDTWDLYSAPPSAELENLRKSRDSDRDALSSRHAIRVNSGRSPLFSMNGCDCSTEHAKDGVQLKCCGDHVQGWWGRNGCSRSNDDVAAARS
jgi:hypothetical protein